MSFHAFCVYFLAFWGRHGRDGERLAQCFAHDCAGRHALGNGRRFGRPATTLAQRNVLFPIVWSCGTVLAGVSELVLYVITNDDAGMRYQASNSSAWP